MNPLLIGLIFALLSNEQDNNSCQDKDMMWDHKDFNGITTIKKMEEKRELQGFLGHENFPGHESFSGHENYSGHENCSGHESFSEALRFQQNDHSFLRPVPPPDVLEKKECDCQS